MSLLQERYQNELDEKARQYIAFAVDGSTRMSALIKDLLEYSKVSAAERESAPVDLAGVFEDARNNLHTAIEEAMAVVTAGPLPTVTADASQMGQLFQNLIGNAIKFRVKDRRPEVRVEARQEAGAWIVTVRDNGIGIAPEQQGRLFAIFERLNTRDEYPGTGIGLATCKRIVERHGGRIWIESEVGKGSTVCFTLPVSP